MLYPARPSESEMRHCTPRRYMHASGMSGACLVELIDANRKKTDGKRVEA